jgi:protein-disulfide isomerase
MSTHAESPTLSVPVAENFDHLRGDPQAAAVLVEYGDFECPYCRQAEGVVRDLSATFGGSLCLVFRHFPLGQIHPHALKAAEAAEAAGVQGRFWEMHDLLYQNQDSLDTPSLDSYADAIGLAMTRFRREMLAGTHAERVRQHFMSGVRSGVNGTPTFFINGKRHDGAWDLESLKAGISAVVDHPRMRRQK